MKKSVFSNKAVKIWTIVASSLVAFLIVVNILATNVFFSLLNIVMPGGGMRAIYADGVDPIYTTEVTSKKEALQNGNSVNLEVCEEGFVLLKN